jgi:hypothetical protein
MLENVLELPLVNELKLPPTEIDEWQSKVEIVSEKADLK